MTKKRRELRHIVSLSLLGTLSCIIIGVVFFGREVFNTHHPFFAFVLFGVTGSIAFSLFSLQRFRDSAYVLALLFLLTLFITGLSKTLVVYFLFFTALTVGVYLFAKIYYAKLATSISARPLVLAAILALTFSAATIVQGLIFAPSRFPPHVFANMPIGFLIGLGLGVGFEVEDYVVQNSLKARNSSAL